MSFDLFVQRFQNGGVAAFPKSVFEEIFCRDAIDPKLPLNNVEYVDGSRAEIYGCEDEYINGLMFTHFGGEMVFARIVELAERTESIIFWADKPPSLAVTNPSIVSQIPTSCLEGVGPAEVVSDHHALMAYISRSR